MYVCLGIIVKHLTKKSKIWLVLSKNLGERYYTHGCGFVIVTPTGNYFGLKMLIRDQLEKIFGVWPLSTWESIINHIGVVLAIATPIGGCFGY